MTLKGYILCDYGSYLHYLQRKCPKHWRAKPTRPKVKPGRIYQSLAPLGRDTGEQKNEKRLSFGIKENPIIWGEK